MSDGPSRTRGRSSLTPIAAFALGFAASVAVAQTVSGSAPARAPSETSKPAPATVPDRSWERTQRATKIIGVDVVNRQGEKVGDIEDVVLDRNGSVAYAVVSTGGFLGVGDRLHAVPWRSLQTNTGTDKFVLDVDKQTLGKAPGFDHNTFPDINQPKWSVENRKHFPVAGSGSEPTMSKSGRSDPPSSSGRGAAGNDVGPTSTTRRSGSTTSAAGSTSGTSAGTTGAAPAETRPTGGLASNPTGSATANPADPAGGVGKPAVTGGGVAGRGAGSDSGK